MRVGDFFIFWFFRGFLYMRYLDMTSLVSVEGLMFLIFAFTKRAQVPFSG